MTTISSTFEGFQILEANTEPRNAEIFLFDETHGDEEGKKKIYGLIQRLYRPGDKVVVEGCEKGAFVPSERFGLASDVVVQGWDNMEARKSVEEPAAHAGALYRAGQRVLDLARQEIEGYTQFHFKLDVVKELVKPYLSKEETIDCMRLFSLSFREQAPYWHQTVLASQKQIEVLACGPSFRERNRSLAESVLSGKRVFAVAGGRHLTTQAFGNSPIPVTCLEGLSLLHEAVQSRAYVILKP